MLLMVSARGPVVYRLQFTPNAMPVLKSQNFRTLKRDAPLHLAESFVQGTFPHWSGISLTMERSRSEGAAPERAWQGDAVDGLAKGLLQRHIHAAQGLLQQQRRHMRQQACSLLPWQHSCSMSQSLIPAVLITVSSHEDSRHTLYLRRWLLGKLNAYLRGLPGTPAAGQSAA